MPAVVVLPRVALMATVAYGTPVALGQRRAAGSASKRAVFVRATAYFMPAAGVVFAAHTVIR